MSNTLNGLEDSVARIREAKFRLYQMEQEQSKFILANADELVERGIVSIQVRVGVLHRQMIGEGLMERDGRRKVMG